jgi:hypothetical protein
LPDALLDKLQVELVDGDKRWRASVNDARNGAMMRAKFQQQTAALAEQQKTWASEKEEFIDYVKAWQKDPDVLIDALESLGMPFDAASRKYAERLQKLDHVWKLEQSGHVPPGTTKELYEAQQRDRELRMLKNQQAREQSKREAEQARTQSEEIGKNLSAEGAKAMQSEGLNPQDPTEWKIFRRHLNEIYAQTQTLPTSAEIVDAAKLAKEEISQYRGHFQRSQETAALRPGAPRNADAGAPDMSKSRPRGAAPKPMTTKEWARQNLYGGFKKKR